MSANTPGTIVLSDSDVTTDGGPITTVAPPPLAMNKACSLTTQAPGTCLNAPPVSSGSLGSDLQVGQLAWQSQGEYALPKESELPREFRQRLHKHFARIEREFEREYRRLYGENLALQERLEKFEDGDHVESTTLAKKLGASMLSQRIKQQYKQSTSRLVSSLRPSAGHGANNPGHGIPGSLPGNVSFGVGSPGQQPNFGSPPGTGGNTATATAAIGSSAVLAGQFSGHSGSWQLVNKINAHRDGIWEVTPFRRFLATASADTTVRLWTNDAQMKAWDHLLLTSSGDGTAHMVRLPFEALGKVAASWLSGQSTCAALETATSALSAEVAGSGNMTFGAMASNIKGSQNFGLFPEPDDDHSVPMDEVIDTSTRPSGPSTGSCNPIHVHHPHAIFQSANLGGGCTSPTTPITGSGSQLGCMDSSPLSAAEFLTGRDQLVTAGWDRLGRIYDLSTGQEVDSLTGHDHQLTDVRCASDGAPVVVTSSRDCTFRLWDFRQPGMRVHVQQAHTQTISTTQFLWGYANERLISAGADRFCRIWDLRQTRGPLLSIRTDAAINRLAISGCSSMFTAMDTCGLVDLSAATTAPPPPTAASNSTDTVMMSPQSGGGGIGLSTPVRSVIGSGASSSNPAIHTSPGGGGGGGSAQCTMGATGSPWATSQNRVLALPLDNRGIKFFDLNGNRIGRLTRSSSRVSESVNTRRQITYLVSNGHFDLPMCFILPLQPTRMKFRYFIALFLLYLAHFEQIHYSMCVL